jgi:hypothetical protein
MVLPYARDLPRGMSKFAASDAVRCHRKKRYSRPDPAKQWRRRYTGLAFGYPWSPEDPDAEHQKFLDEQREKRAEMEAEQKRLEAERIAAKKKADGEAAVWKAKNQKCDDGWDRLSIGMTQKEAFALACEPWDVNTTETLMHKTAQWVYSQGHRNGYLYFEDGRLVAIQRRN